MGWYLAEWKAVIYTDYEIRLDKGDKIFVYTDGVPEATDIRRMTSSAQTG